MLTLRPLHLLALAALFAVPLSSCSSPEAAEHMTAAPAPDSTRFLATDTIATPIAIATGPAKRNHRRVIVVDRSAPLMPVSPEDLVSSSNPACLQLIAAEERLRIAQAEYQSAMARFTARAQNMQDRKAEGGSEGTANVANGYPAAANREYLVASMAVRSLRNLCPDRH